MTERRVLHVVTNETWGGACRIVHLLATGCVGDATVVCGPGDRLQDRLESDGVPTVVESRLRSSPHPPDDLRALHSIRRTIVAVDPDLVHCHSTKAGALGRLAALSLGVPTVFTVHGWGFYSPSQSWLSRGIALGERLLAPQTRAIVCVSDRDYERGAARSIVSRTTSTVVHNGVPPIDSPDRTALTRALGHPETPVVGTLGRLAEQKDPLSVLSVAQRLSTRGVDVTTAMIGDGPLMAACQRFRDQHNLNAHLLGFREDAHDLLGGFDVFVLPSRFEGLPLAVLEAMHRAVPVVAYDVGGVAEAVVDGETGYVVPAGDERALADRVERLVEEPDTRTEMGKRARERARTEFTAGRMCSEYDELYRRLLGDA